MTTKVYILGSAKVLRVLVISASRKLVRQTGVNKSVSADKLNYLTLLNEIYLRITR